MKTIVSLVVILSFFVMIGCEGPEGLAGPTGPSGSNGSSGQDGENGQNGQDGQDGQDGENGNTPTLMPYNPRPPDGETISRILDVVDGKLLLTWSVNAIADDEIEYDIYFGESVPPPLIIEDSVDQFALVEYTNSRIYLWQIKATNSAGEVSLGPIWRLRTPS